MATAVIPPKAQLSEAAEYRNFIVSDCMERLQHMAWRALNVLGKQNDEIVIVCIQVDDDRWRDIVDLLMPNEDWQMYRDMGKDPIARGSAMWPLCEVVAERLPPIADVIMEKPPEGKVKLIALAEGGGTVYDIEPLPASGHN